MTTPGFGIIPRGQNAGTYDAPRVPVRSSSRPLVDQLIGSFDLPFFFQAIPTSSAAPNVSAGASAWFGLASWSVPDDTRGQAVWIGTRCQLGPCNPTGAASSDFSVVGTQATYGTVDGMGFAVVVGLNLPCVRGAWSEGPGTVPMVEGSSSSASSLWNGQGQAQNRAVFHAPPGSFASSPWPTAERYIATSPAGVVLSESARIDVAVVVRGAQYNTAKASSRLILNRCFGSLVLATTITPTSFG